MALVQTPRHLFFFFVFQLIVGLSVAYFLAKFIPKNYQQKSLSEANLFLDLVVRESNAISTEAKIFLSVWAEEISQLEPENPCQAITTQKLFNSRHFSIYGVADTNGNIICSSIPPQDPINISDRPYFQKVLKDKIFAIGEYQLGKVTGNASVSAAYPLLSSDGQVDRVLILGLDLDWINDFFTNLNPPKNINLVITDKLGQILVNYPQDSSKWGTKGFSLDVFNIILSEQSGHFTKDKQIYAYQPFNPDPNDGHLSSYAIVSQPVSIPDSVSRPLILSLTPLFLFPIIFEAIFVYCQSRHSKSK